MKQRGDTAQIQRAEEQLDEIKQVQVCATAPSWHRLASVCLSVAAALAAQNEVHDLNTKLDAIIEHLNIQVPSAQPPMER
eukprot:scaffold6501_cov323-Prasinococcus_capsulatus_cf.AAC.3